ncbi:MAG: hypothetical protein ABR875_03135 [Minisyncoccia bacterium]
MNELGGVTGGVGTIGRGIGGGIGGGVMGFGVVGVRGVPACPELAEGVAGNRVEDPEPDGERPADEGAGIAGWAEKEPGWGVVAGLGCIGGGGVILGVGGGGVVGGVPVAGNPEPADEGIGFIGRFGGGAPTPDDEDD